MTLYDIFYLILGLVLGYAFLKVVEVSTQNLVKGYASGLVVAALIYIPFSILWGTFTWFSIETIGVIIYGAFAYLALKKSPLYIAVGWLLHPIWDVFLHRLGPGRHVAPDWYSVTCLSFDVLVAVYIYRQYKSGALQI